MMDPEDFLFEQIRIYEEIARRRRRNIVLTILAVLAIIASVFAYLYWS